MCIEESQSRVSDESEAIRSRVAYERPALIRIDLRSTESGPNDGGDYEFGS